MTLKNLCGQRIKEIRKERKMNQIDLVTALEDEFHIKLDSTSLGRIERNERGIWDFELLAISKILNVSLDWLLEGITK
jgi:HTH-type transcriptional regulator, cell division transcriptional repressor